MENYTLIINHFAEEDIKDAIVWYNEQKENLGDEFLQDVKSLVLRINNKPLQFPIIRKNIRRAILNRFPYAIFFIISDSNIIVFAVFHTKRNPKLWEKRRKL